MDKTRYYHQGIEAALDVVEAFLKSDYHALGITEISKLTGLNKNRTFRILTTLVKRGYVERSANGVQYKLGRGFLIIGEATRNQLDLRQISEPFLKSIAEESGDAAYLLVLFGHQAVTIARYLGKFSNQIAEPINETIPLHIGASPKLLLANLPENERAKILATMELSIHGPNTITNREKLLRELEEIRNRGYSLSIEETEAGTIAVAAPIRDHSGLVVAGVSISTPIVRHTQDRLEKNTQLVLTVANGISEKLGYFKTQER
jgi:IclR family KDG regulon transcriptional repressor